MRRLKQYSKSNTRNPLFLLGLSTYATGSIAVVSELATSYPPSSTIPAGVEGANTFYTVLFTLGFFYSIFLFARFESYFLEKRTGIRPDTIIVAILFVLGSIYISKGSSNAFLIVMIGYASVLALVYEVYSIPLKSADEYDFSDDVWKVERQDWWRTVQVTLTFSVAVVLGTGLSTYTDVFLAPKHILILIGLPAIGIGAVLLRGVQQMRRLKPDPN